MNALPQPQPLDIWNRTWICYWLRFCYEFENVPVQNSAHFSRPWRIEMWVVFSTYPSPPEPNQTKTNWTVCEIHLNMHSTISTLCISISHLVTKSRTIFRCIWMQYVCACVCNVYSVLYILWIVIFLWSFVCSLYAGFSLEGKFSFFLFSFLFVCCESNKASQNIFFCVIVGVLRVPSLLYLQIL